MSAEARHYEQTFRWAANYLLSNGFGISDLEEIIEEERKRVSDAVARKLFSKEVSDEVQGRRQGSAD